MAPIDDYRTIRGAYRLAIEGLASFACLPGQTDIRTVSMHRTGRSLYFIWPIWSSPITFETAWSRLTPPAMSMVMRGEQCSKDAIIELRHRGVAAVYYSEKIRPTDYSNFTPARCIFQSSTVRRRSASARVVQGRA